MSDDASRLGKYDLLEAIDEGITGTLFKARNRETGQPVFLKVISDVISRSPQFRKKFFDQWASHQTLIDHPNIANVLEFGREAESYFVAVEFEEGQRLSERLQSGPIEPEEGVEILRQIAEGLRAAHRLGVVHGNLTPHCVIVGRDKMKRLLVRVVFFDVAVHASESMVSIYGELVGVPKYIAPEVIKGATPSVRSDMFSLGVIGYETLAGKEPFPSEHTLGYLHANCNASFLPLTQVLPAIPRELAEIIERALSRDPAKRYQSCQALVDDFDRYDERMKTGRSAVVPAGADSAFAPTYKVPRHRAREGSGANTMTWLGVGSMVVALAAMAVTLIALSKGPRTPGEKNTSEKGGPPVALNTGEEPNGKQPAAQENPRLVREQQKKREDEAEERYSEAMDRYKEYKKRNEFKICVPLFTRIINDYGDTHYAREARMSLAALYCDWANFNEKQGEYLDAAENLKSAVSMAPPNSTYRTLFFPEIPKLLLQAANAETGKGNYEKALNLLTEIKTDYKSTLEAGQVDERMADIEINRGYDMIREEKYKDALAQFQRVATHYRGTKSEKIALDKIPDVYLNLARELISGGKIEEGRAKLDEIMKGYKNTVAADQARKEAEKATFALYERYRTAGEADKAAAEFNRLRIDYPDSVFTQRVVREKLGFVPRKGDPLFDEKTAEDRLIQVNKLRKDGDYDEAIKLGEEILRRTTGNSDIAREILKLLPEMMFESAGMLYGTGHKTSGEKRYFKLAEQFGFTSWGRKAAEIKKAIVNTPTGMVFVPAGSFRMGSSELDMKRLIAANYPKNLFETSDPESFKTSLDALFLVDQTPQFLAATESFYIDAKEVANAEYKKFVDETGHKPPLGWVGGACPRGTENFPVVNVTCDDAAAYAKWARKRLPTEEEWEKAARGTDTRIWPWGNEFDEARVNYSRANTRANGPITVGSKLLGTSPYGCMDMIGNVWEWTSSWYRAYPGGRVHSVYPNGGKNRRVVRGGGWYPDRNDIPPRCALRKALVPSDATIDVGFRCVRDVDAK